MKISKTAVLTVGSALMIAGLGLLFVSASDSFPSKTLVVDPNNAVQQFVRVRIVPTESGDNSMADIVKKGNLFGIETDYNFALSRTGTEANQISGNSMGSSILGGIINRILGGKYNGILGGKNNEISTGNNNGILGGENNKIDAGNYSVIFGGKGNKSNGSYLSIVGGSGNTANSGNYLVVVGKNNVARGYNSVVMGSGSKLDATASFLWTDGSRADALKNDHVFAVLGDSGMVINATEAHELAQLTISGSLVIYDDKNAPECTQETKGVVKVVNGNGSVGSNKCFCSCNGSGRNPLHEGARCTSCNDKIEEITQVCGKVERVCSSDPYLYTGNTTSGACVYGELVNGTGAFFVSTKREGNVLTNYINRSCQLSSGGVIELCQQKLEGNGCENHFTGECLWREGVDTGNIMMSNNRTPKDTATYWTYDVTGFNEDKLCTYKCDEYSERDGKRCVQYECTGVLGDGAELYDKTLLPKNGNTPYFYSETSSGACSYYCTGDYYYDATEDKCVTCPEGEVYVNGKCTTVCDMSKTNYGNITLMDDDGYAITIADRNVGATDSDITKPESLGCYFQWGNNYGFQPLGGIKTGNRVDASKYGSSKYSSEYYVVIPEFHTEEFNYGDWSTIPNNNLWGGSGDSKANAFGIKVTQKQKKDRQGPCPEGYHVPSIGEWSDLFTIWYKKQHGSVGWEYVKDGGLIVNSHERSDIVGFIDAINWAPLGERDNQGSAAPRSEIESKGGAYWASSSPWIENSLMDGANAMRPEPNNANSFDFSVDNTWGGQPARSYLGHGTWGVKGSGQGVRCFKDEPICPEGKRWNQTDLKCEEYDDTEVVDLEVFMVSSTGSISHYVMMDRNLGATEVYNQNSSYPNSASYGHHYQWGNNFGFPIVGDINTTEYVDKYLVDASGYGPNNYYFNSTFIKATTNWDTSDNDNLWGEIVNTPNARKGPCPEGYHVPSVTEWRNIYDNWNNANCITSSVGVQYSSDFLMPFAGIRSNFNDLIDLGNKGFYWLSSTHNRRSYYVFFIPDNVSLHYGYRATGYPVRCVKNNLTTSPQKITIHANGGTGAVISIDWETSSRGKIVALGEPTKAGYTFGGWYTNSSFTNRVSKGSTISEGSHLSAKWVRVNDTPETIKITCNLSDPAVVEWCDNSAIPSAKLGNIKYQISVGNKDIPIDVYTKIDYIAWYNGNYEVIDNNSGRLKHVTNVSGYQNNRDGFSPSSTTCNTNGHSNVYITKYASLSPDSEVTEKTITNDGKTYNISLECNVPQLGTIVDECTVTYDLGDGEGKGGKLVGRSSNTEIVNCGEKVTLPNATWDRHEFWGWLKNGVRVGGFGNDYMVGEDVTLKAYWGEYTCNGSVPENANFVEGSDSDLDRHVDRKVYPYAEIFDSNGKYKGTVKCAYSCKPGYIAYEGECVPCQVGSWDESDPDHCAADIDCGDNAAWDTTLGKCAAMGTCRKSGGQVYELKNISVLGNINRTKISDILPLPGEGDKYFECVDDRDDISNVSKNSCQYKCQEGSYCQRVLGIEPYKCVKPYCDHSGGRGFYTGGTPSLDQVSTTALWMSSEFVENINNEQEFYDYVSSHQPGCYYRCPEKNRWRGCDNDYSQPYCYSEETIKSYKENCDNKDKPYCANDEFVWGYYYKNTGNPTKVAQSWIKKDSESEASLHDCAFSCDTGTYYTRGYYVDSYGTLTASSKSHFCRKKCGSDQYFGNTCRDCPAGTILDTSGPSATLTDESSGITITQYTTCKAIECPSGTQLSLPEGKTCKSSLQDGKCPPDMPNGKMIDGECKICLDPTKTITDSGECI